MPAVERTASTFRLGYRVRCEIRAPRERVWALLTDAKRFPAWNSTVTSLDGVIAVGQKLTLRVPISERTFHPRVRELVANERMVWADGFAPMFRGVRTFTLGGGTTFEMAEVFSGLMLPMIRRSLPDFTDAFAAYATDLKRTAESG